MNIEGKHYRTIWPDPQNKEIIQIIDQTKLPFQFEVLDLSSLESVVHAIFEMQVRGAGLIGATAAYGMYLATLKTDPNNFKNELFDAGEKLQKTRPTAVNLQWAVDIQMECIKQCSSKEECVEMTFASAQKIADDDAGMCKQIGVNGLKLLKELAESNDGKTVNILTHCNAGWLAFVDYGSATSPIYAAHDAGIDVHVWVDETRPRNQGARLTSWELLQHGVPHTVIPDNAGGHLMQHGLVDIVITGADRVTKVGDAANKIGTYLKALAARDNGIPFYIALPSSTFDWNISDGVREIPIEQREEREVKYMLGYKDGIEQEFLIMPQESKVANYGFDVTPSNLITGLITENGICDASEDGIKTLFRDISKAL